VQTTKQKPPGLRPEGPLLCTHLRTASLERFGQPAQAGWPCNTHQGLSTAATFRSWPGSKGWRCTGPDHQHRLSVDRPGSL